jgi:gas vesicle protein
MFSFSPYVGEFTTHNIYNPYFFCIFIYLIVNTDKLKTINSARWNVFFMKKRELKYIILKNNIMERRISNTILGFLAGAVTGAVIGILMAPDKGSRTRRGISSKIKNSKKDLATTMKEKVDELKYEVNEMVEEMQKKLNEAESKMRNRAKKAEKKMKEKSGKFSNETLTSRNSPI